MNKIIKIWFDGEWLYGLGDDSKTYRQSLFYGINDCYMPTKRNDRSMNNTIGIHFGASLMKM